MKREFWKLEIPHARNNILGDPLMRGERFPIIFLNLGNALLHGKLLLI